MKRKVECPKCGEEVHTATEHLSVDGHWTCDE